MRKNITKEMVKACGVFEGVGIMHFDVSINNNIGKKRLLHTRKGVRVILKVVAYDVGIFTTTDPFRQLYLTYFNMCRY